MPNLGTVNSTTSIVTTAELAAASGQPGGTDVAVADGGTGASTASGARTNLGLVLGTDVASLTAGVVPIAQLATGTPSGAKFIRDDGTLQTPAGGSGLVLVQTQTASASATLDFTTSISATYDQYLIEIDHLIPASNGVTLYLRFSTDGGSTYIATVYQWNHHLTYGAGTTADEGSASDVGILFGNSIASAGAGVWGTVRLSKPAEAGTTYKTANLDTTRGHTSVGLVHDTGIGYLSVAAVNAFRFLFSTGNIASGVVRVYGIAKS